MSARQLMLSCQLHAYIFNWCLVLILLNCNEIENSLFTRTNLLHTCACRMKPNFDSCPLGRHILTLGTVVVVPNRIAFTSIQQKCTSLYVCVFACHRNRVSVDPTRFDAKSSSSVSFPPFARTPSFHYYSCYRWRCCLFLDV